jgi:hypothetical protein
VKIGDVVRHKVTGEYGTIHYSMFGVSIHTYDEENKILRKTIGDRIEEVNKYWEVVDMPEGYEKYPEGGIIKINNTGEPN